MQMQQIRYFLALCEERSFTRAAKRCGVSQPSLTNAIIRLEQKLGGALFQRKPLVALTVLGHAVHPYFDLCTSRPAQLLCNVFIATSLRRGRHEALAL
jgi:DNA-binding transcriptional LysR family regulator